VAEYLTLTPHDPLVARDGRPFGAGQGIRMRCVDWPYPSVLAGSLRSLLGKSKGGNFDPNDIAALKGISVAGPLPLIDDQLYFPTPRDLVVWEDDQGKRRLTPLRPQKLPDGAGCDLPAGLLPVAVTEDVKPAKPPAFWSCARFCDRLLDAPGQSFADPPESANTDANFLDAPEKAERTHVQIDPAIGAAAESLLFMTVGLDLNHRHPSGNPDTCILAARVEAAGDYDSLVRDLDCLHPLGGERRLAYWRRQETLAWQCPDAIARTLPNVPRVRLVLATPALFEHGWRPDWLGADWQGSPPGLSVRLRLVAACVERWKPISGWSLEQGRIGPKALHRLVPAGSVYFFEVLQGSDTGQLAQQGWLSPVSDSECARRDGFGLAVWGIWDFAKD
jgi:CRISPR-associated protein Cmr3